MEGERRVAWKKKRWMNIDDRIKGLNCRLFGALGEFLNETPEALTAELVKQFCGEAQCGTEEAFAYLLAAACGLDIAGSADDMELFVRQLRPGVHLLDEAVYASDPYYSCVEFPSLRSDAWQMCRMSYKPFEAFVCNDIVRLADGRQIPQVGFFASRFDYPAVLQEGRIWMTVTPNEVETMREAIARAHGNVLAYGLGLGYYIYMVSCKSGVGSVTVVDCDATVIRLFENHLLPQFPFRDKVRVVCDDAYRFAEQRMAGGGYDCVFTDLWHDVSDGVPGYLRMKCLEPLLPGADFSYWIEKSLTCYL